jgi:hypothetical protein
MLDDADIFLGAYLFAVLVQFLGLVKLYLNPKSPKTLDIPFYSPLPHFIP